MHGLWAKLPDEIQTFGDARGWLKVRKLIKLILIGELGWNIADTDEEDNTTSKRVAYVKRISNEIKNKVSKSKKNNRNPANRNGRGCDEIATVDAHADKAIPRLSQNVHEI